MKKITGIMKLVLSAIWSDKNSRKTLLWILGTLPSTLVVLWNFPLHHLTNTGQMSPDTQLTIRIIGTEVIVAAWLITLNRLAFYYYDKTKAPASTLTPEERQRYKNLLAFELAQKAYEGKNARKLIDFLNSLTIPESEKHDIYDKVVLLDRGRPSKSNPFKKEA